MANWSESMKQTFEYYIVNPRTWRDEKLIDNVKSCTISRNTDSETLGSATFDIADSIGECYIRVYLIVVQNGVQEKYPLGTYLVQTPYASFDGKRRSVSVDAYTPLLELKENPPPLGYSIPKGTNIMDIAYQLAQENARAPVIGSGSDSVLYYDFVSEPNGDTWLSFLTDLISNAKYSFALDEMGRILFTPKQDTASLQPVWTYDHGSNSSILYPEMSIDHDLYDIPNVVEVVYSNAGDNFYARVVNDDPNSPISTVSRGREIVHRVTDPDVIGSPTENWIHKYADQLLRDLSTLEYTVSYTHGYCPVRIGDCIRLNHSMAGLNGIKAKVVSQSISCEPGCPVTEKAVYTKKLWG